MPALNHVNFYKGKNTKHPPLLLLHGLLGSSSNFNSLCETTKLRQSHDIYAMDLLNHGKSRRCDHFDLVTMSDHLIETVDKIGLQKFSVLGHSLGGKVAMIAALRNKDRICSLVVEDIAPVGYTDKTDKSNFVHYAKSMLALNLDKIEKRSDADNLLARKVPEPLIRSFLLQNLSKNTKTSRYEWKANLGALLENYGKLLNFEASLQNIQSFGGPVLFLKGEKSNYIRSGYYGRMKSLFPAYNLAVIKGAGHWVHFEKLLEFRRSVEKFMEMQYNT